jgi:hypothetical protein
LRESSYDSNSSRGFSSMVRMFSDASAFDGTADPTTSEDVGNTAFVDLLGVFCRPISSGSLQWSIDKPMLKIQLANAKIVAAIDDQLSIPNSDEPDFYAIIELKPSPLRSKKGVLS